MIDLDGVSYDLPIRDLRKLITSTMDDMGTWDPVWIRGMIEAYHQANPIDRETFELLWIDMAFPNEFYKHVKEIVFSPQIFLQTELEAILTRVMTVESSKWQALQELEADKTKYESGNYVFESGPAFQYEFEPVPARDLPGSMVLCFRKPKKLRFRLPLLIKRLCLSHSRDLPIKPCRRACGRPLPPRPAIRYRPRRCS
ncbi:hypothetical protein ACHHV8_28065 [Paenibacillus sp. TAB 01]|uniref:hypothetical protein n=1 Tax=Paenibacillus sp. TAB 01 TaxID=3368988 RepID=UPI003750B8BD